MRGRNQSDFQSFEGPLGLYEEFVRLIKKLRGVLSARFDVLEVQALNLHVSKG